MRIALLADIHGNLPALEAVMADFGARGIDAVIDLGDCVSGPLWPRETYETLRAAHWPTVRGNHDRWVGEGQPASLSRTDAFAAEAVGQDGRRWLLGLPSRLEPAPGILAIHARPDDDDAYLTEDIVEGRLVAASPATVAARLGPPGAALVLAAHSHLAAMVRLPDGRWVVNPGSVGCPAYHDPTSPAHVSESLSPAARYALLDIDLGDPPSRLDRTELIAIPYDHAAAARRAAALDRPDWAYALAHGAMPGRATEHRVSKDTP